MNNPEIIRALTPWFLSSLGFGLGMASLLAPDLDGSARNAGMVLASTALGGAAGLAEKAKSLQVGPVQGNADIHPSGEQS